MMAIIKEHKLLYLNFILKNSFVLAINFPEWKTVAKKLKHLKLTSYVPIFKYIWRTKLATAQKNLVSLSQFKENNDRQILK